MLKTLHQWNENKTLIFFGNMRHAYEKSLLRLKQRLCATLGANGSTKCEGGEFMDGITT
jgi:hypothetical protein